MAAKANPIIIRRMEVIEHGGHHGGSWKVAYGDFMTALMAFFLLLWILSTSNEDKLRGIAEYFTNATLPGGSGVLDGATLGPPGTLTASDGANDARGANDGTTENPAPTLWDAQDNALIVDQKEKLFGAQDEDLGSAATGGLTQHNDQSDHTLALTAAEKIDAEVSTAESDRAAELAKFEALKAEILEAIDTRPDIQPLKNSVLFEVTQEGLMIQIVDQNGQPMFSSGRADMHRATRNLIAELGTSLGKIENSLVIAGHTDAVPFSQDRSYDNWDLSSDRANATRRLFEASGISQKRITRVSGLADSDPLVPENPKHASNRRVSVLVKFDDIVSPPQPASVVAVQKPTWGSGVTKARLNETTAEAPQLTQLETTVFSNLRDALR